MTQILWMKKFLYFEIADVCLNTFKKGEKFAITDVKFEHLGLNLLSQVFRWGKIEIGIIIGRNIKKTIIISTP